MTTMYPNISDTDLAYAAGIIDGEGSICLTINHYKSRNTKAYILRVIVNMTDSTVVLWLKQTFGGNLCYTTPRNRCALYNWCITTNKAVPFLQAIYPFLKIKKSQADIALEFQGNKRKAVQIYGNAGIPKVIRDAEAILASRLKDLHRRAIR